MFENKVIGRIFGRREGRRKRRMEKNKKTEEIHNLYRSQDDFLLHSEASLPATCVC
jgi:hypothetical protein